MNELHAVGAALLAAGAVSTAATAQSMAVGENGYVVSAPLLTIGETLSGTTGALNPTSAGDYQPVGILDGLGAYELDAQTVRVISNHELLHFRGKDWEIDNGAGGTFTLTGARLSYFDIDKSTRTIVDAGLAINRIYDGNGNVATDESFLTEGFVGLSRFCSSQLVEAGTYGLEDTIYFTGEEDGSGFNPVGGAEWALDVATGDFWQVPAMGRGAWENLTPFQPAIPGTVGFILADDSSPFDADGDGENEVSPLYAYIGIKQPGGDFLERNGLAVGFLFVWVPLTNEKTPLDWSGSGFVNGRFVPVNNAQQPALASGDGATGWDEYGYPTQRNLWTQAKALGAFGFSRPEDLSTNPTNPTQVVLASTGVDTYAVDPVTGDGADTFGTLYAFQINPFNGETVGIILYDGDADPTRALRSPDNLDWADDGFIYVQEDEAEEDTLTGEPLFGPGASNPREASIVRVSTGGQVLRVAEVDRSVVLDPTIAVPTDAVDVDAGAAGEWETSGILDVSTLFDVAPGTLFLFDVQAHGIEDQDGFNPESQINDADLVEGGQLLFLERT